MVASVGDKTDGPWSVDQWFTLRLWGKGYVLGPIGNLEANMSGPIGNLVDTG